VAIIGISLLEILNHSTTAPSTSITKRVAVGLVWKSALEDPHSGHLGRFVDSAQVGGVAGVSLGGSCVVGYAGEVEPWPRRAPGALRAAPRADE